MNRLARMATWLFSGGLVIVFSLGWVPVGWPS